MRKAYYIFIGLLMVFLGCEDYYVADLDPGAEMLVVEARLQAGASRNQVQIFRTVGFYEEEKYPPVNDAQVSIIDEKNQNDALWFIGNGTYQYNQGIVPGKKYKLVIRCDGEVYESEYESAPAIPEIDSVYGELTTKTIVALNSSGGKDVETVDGIQLNADIKNPDSPQYYRFYGRKVLLSSFPFDTVMGTPVTVAKYVWRSFYPSGGYNIAAPGEYSSGFDIYKHPLEFFKLNNQEFMTHDDNEFERGWIYILYQYRISASGYRFYEELNKQLESEGKIFDPIYTQALGNIKCISDGEKVILGNFEVYNFREYRFFVRYISAKKGFVVREIEKFYYIPEKGIQTYNVPDFWEH